MKVGLGPKHMTDTFSPRARKRVMSRITSKNTRPEIDVRKYLYSKGLRYRLHRKNLPGKPDIVISRIKSVIFVNGCFWHHHDGCKRSNWPKSNKDYWIPKIERNIVRDRDNIVRLSSLGWKSITVWECETKNLDVHGQLQRVIQEYFDKDENE